MSSIVAFRPRSTVLAGARGARHGATKTGARVKVGALIHATGDQYKDSNGNVWTYDVMTFPLGYLTEAVSKVRASTPGYGGITTEYMNDSGAESIDAYIDAFALNEKNAATGKPVNTALPPPAYTTATPPSMFSTPVVVAIVLVVGFIGYKILA